MGSPVALTGTPGTGKSAVARRLSSTYRTVEVGDLALELGAGRSIRGGVAVDVVGLERRMKATSAGRRYDLVVGHLAHLLPIRDAIVLRCHPRELLRRLGRARRGSTAERRENLVAETTDVILSEALERRRRVWEVDTTGRSVASVAREVARTVERRGRPRWGAVDWLADPSVPELLRSADR